MPTSKRQHFLPQYYFRFFSTDRKHINVLVLASDRLINGAGIKHQCASSYFYGGHEAEETISEIENLHHPIVSKIVQTRTLPMERSILFQAVLFQRARSSLEREKPRAAMAKLDKKAVQAYARTMEEGLAKQLILKGSFTVDSDGREWHVPKMAMMLEGGRLISDLRAVLINNTLSRPFIFSDSPVVLFNHASRHIRYRGTDGLQSPGLQIVMPLDPTLLLLMYDPNHYSSAARTDIIDLDCQPDLDALNTLQLHNSGRTVFFHNWSDHEYVQGLWQGEKPRKQTPEMIVVSHELKDDGGQESELVHLYEPALECELDLTFLTCTPVEDTGRILVRDQARVRAFDTVVDSLNPNVE